LIDQDFQIPVPSDSLILVLLNYLFFILTYLQL